MLSVVLLAATFAYAWAIPVPDQQWTTPCGYSQYANAGVEGGSKRFNKEKIVNGWEARDHEFPYQLSLKRSGSSHFCGAVFFNSRFAMTAAHCTASVTAATLVVVFGETTRNAANPNRRDVGATAIRDHEDYNDRTLQNDISIITLAATIATANHQYPVCVPAAAPASLDGASVTVSGWGTERSGGTVTQELRYVNVQKITDADCRADYPAQIFAGMICAGGYQRDSCQGDSGGPLVYKRGGSFELTGLVSWGAGCAAGNAGVYTDVWYYRSWINGIIGLDQ